MSGFSGFPICGAGGRGSSWKLWITLAIRQARHEAQIAYGVRKVRLCRFDAYMDKPAQLDITPRQCRAARVLIDWSREQLAGASKVGLRTLVDFERGARAPRNVTVDAIRSALEGGGVVFVDANGEGSGVRLRKP